ncbi:uncharacterized protein [Rutidosis leptorrhynchoides]|uniref:uncharacterized protein n=1 Tax=Rutidosis leptorrhynchoides TaxID=125765 RepID=UPI003A99D423
MAQNQLIDSLTSHISLYHSSISVSPPSNTNPRLTILKWFASLNVHQRQACLTTVDFKHTQLLIQMLGELHNKGQGRFITLPDLPSPEPPFLPGLCYKKSTGLLARVAESNEFERLIFESIRLFSSSEGEKIEECSCYVTCLDSVTVSMDFVENVDKFVEIMDRVSNGRFLRGEASELGSDWVEFEWLKEKGYYTIESFVVNRLEVALRLAWLNNCGSGKKRGVRLREKLNAAGIAANLYWRKKACVDWWTNLDSVLKQKVLVTVLGKSAKSLTSEILKGATSASEDKRWLFSGVENGLRYSNCHTSQRTISRPSADTGFGIVTEPVSLSSKPTYLSDVFDGVRLLHDIISLMLSFQHDEYDVEKLFFSAFGSISTISDCILRKLRGFLMVISLDCTKLELLREGNNTIKPAPKKSKEKPASGSRKKERPIVRESKVTCLLVVVMIAHLDTEKKAGLNIIHHQNDNDKETSPPEHAQDLVVGKGPTKARNNRKVKKKKKSLDAAVEVRNSVRTVNETSPSSLLSQNKVEKSGVLDNFNSEDASDESLTRNGIFASTSSHLSSTTENNTEYISSRIMHEDCIVSSTIAVSPHFPVESSEIQMASSRLETPSCIVDYNPKPPLEVPAPKQCSSVCCSVGINLQNLHEGEFETKPAFSDKMVGVINGKEDSPPPEEQDNKKFYQPGATSSLEWFSYEWPSVAPVYFQSINSHFLPMTDRLHLDGHNWQNHIRQPFVPAIHRARNPSLEGGGSPILSQPLPMSLDWPPMVRSACGLVPSLTCSYDSNFIADFVDLPEPTNTPDPLDECKSHWTSEEEFEVHAVSGIDYNQYFGGGVMYWDPSDHPGTGFSRPPSLSSDDSSWAWHEADLNRAVDDMVAFSSNYSTNGLTSPTATPFCSPFDTLGTGHNNLGYVVHGNELSGKILDSPSTTDVTVDEEVSDSSPILAGDTEGKSGDSLPYPMLRPIIIPNVSRERSRSDFKRSHDHKSPCVPPTKREPRIKRPPSPVVLCVPRAPRPPPPSPISDSRRHRGFPSVRSGSSSPRHWGVRGWYHDGTNLEEGCLRRDGVEVVWPSWRNKNLTHSLIQPLPGALIQDHLIALSQLARDQEHPDVALPLQPPESHNCPTPKGSLSLMLRLLHDEIDTFCKQVAAENTARKPFISWALKRVTRSLQVLWPRSRTNVFGSNATGLSLPTSDVDLVVCLPPVRNLEPIKEAGILEGRNGIKETCLQHAARYLANQEWVKNDSLKTVENTAIPIIMLVVEVPHDLINTTQSPKEDPLQEPSNGQSPNDDLTLLTNEHSSNLKSDMVGLEDSASPICLQMNCASVKDVKSVRLDISFKTPSHTGLQTTELVKELTEQFPAAIPLALVLKQFLADRSLDQSYSGGLSSYCLVLLITRFLQHEHHLGRPLNQNFGSLLMDFLYFFGNVFDPRQMRISVQGSGVYIKRERGHSIDPIHIDDPLFPTNNVGRNCFRIHQCIKAFSEAYSVLDSELTCLPDNADTNILSSSYRLLPKIIPSMNTS